MSIITITSDFGNNSHYQAILKGSILSLNEKVQIVDISNNIDSFDIEQGSFILRSSYKSFPSKTIHIFALECDKKHPPIIANVDNHYFIGNDNGFLGLLGSKNIESVYKVKERYQSKFIYKDTFGPLAAKISNGIKIKALGIPFKNFKILNNYEVRKNSTQIVGRVIHIDNYGNLISNIDKIQLKEFIQDKNFFLQIGREKFYKINDYYSDVEDGETFCIFNSLNLLEIGINHGNASQLLGGKRNSFITVNIE